MAYTRPTGSVVDFEFDGPAYTRPAGGAVDFSWVPPTPLAVVDFGVDIEFEVVCEHNPNLPEAVADFAVEVAADVQAAHGISGAAAFAIDVVVDVAAAHPRYVLKGEVRESGVLVNRTVRAYRRSDGAFIGEQLTDLGRFDIHAGFSAAEHYLLPIDLDSGATDFTPPAVNRVLSVLAED